MNFNFTKYIEKKQSEKIHSSKRKYLEQTEERCARKSKEPENETNIETQKDEVHVNPN
jgi:hypothetical protein